jgi:hypothetical protein
MLLRKSMIALLLFLISNFIFSQDITEYPSEEKVIELMDNDPLLIVSMVQKLYVLEHSYPVLTLPPILLLKVNDNLREVNNNYSEVIGNLTIVTFGGKNAELKIGTDKYNLFYSIPLNVSKVIYTPESDNNSGFTTGSVLLIGAGCFCAGFLVGYIIFH